MDVSDHPAALVLRAKLAMARDSPDWRAAMEYLEEALTFRAESLRGTSHLMPFDREEALEFADSVAREANDKGALKADELVGFQEELRKLRDDEQTRLAPA